MLGECLAEGDVATGLRICTAIRPCMLVRGEFALGCEWVDAFLSRPEAAGSTRGSGARRSSGAPSCPCRVDPAGAEPVARAGLELCRAAGDEFWTAAGLNLLSEIAVHTGRPDEAEALGREAMAIAEAAGDSWNTGWALGIRAAIAGVRGNIARGGRAGQRLDRGHARRSTTGGASPGPSSASATSPGCAATWRGAQLMYSDALGYLREIGARPEIARCLSGLGRVALDLGDIEAAREHLAESLRVCRDIGTRIGMARGLESFAALADREGDAERAVLLAAASAALRATSGLPPPPGARAGRLPRRRRPPRRGHGPRCCGHAASRCPPEAAIDLAIGRPAGHAGPRAAPGGPLRQRRPRRAR